MTDAERRFLLRALDVLTEQFAFGPEAERARAKDRHRALIGTRRGERGVTTVTARIGDLDGAAVVFDIYFKEAN